MLLRVAILEDPSSSIFRIVLHFRFVGFVVLGHFLCEWTNLHSRVHYFLHCLPRLFHPKLDCLEKAPQQAFGASDCSMGRSCIVFDPGLSHYLVAARTRKCRTTYRIRRLRLSRLLLVQAARHSSPRIINNVRHPMKMRAWYGPYRLGAVDSAERQVVGEWTLAPIASEPLGYGDLFMCKAQVTLPDGANFSLIATGNVRPNKTSFIFQGINKSDKVTAQGAAEERLQLRVTTGRGGTLQVIIGGDDGDLRDMPNHVPDPTSPSVTPPAGAGGALSVGADH
jgi:hypothetical protein